MVEMSFGNLRRRWVGGWVGGGGEWAEKINKEKQVLL
jgi:hypothetical protein